MAWNHSRDKGPVSTSVLIAGGQGAGGPPHAVIRAVKGDNLGASGYDSLANACSEIISLLLMSCLISSDAITFSLQQTGKDARSQQLWIV